MSQFSNWKEDKEDDEKKEFKKWMCTACLLYQELYWDKGKSFIESFQ
jgi:hypothetical protein